MVDTGYMLSLKGRNLYSAFYNVYTIVYAYIILQMQTLTLCHPAYWILVKVRGGVLRTHSYI